MEKRESTTEDAPTNYWFPAKCYGWGWGFPCSWQGWLVFSLFLVVCLASEKLGGGSILGTVGVVLIAAAILLAICYWKGEPPRWNWGNKTNRE